MSHFLRGASCPGAGSGGRRRPLQFHLFAFARDTREHVVTHEILRVRRFGRYLGGGGHLAVPQDRAVREHRSETCAVLSAN